MVKPDNLALGAVARRTETGSYDEADWTDLLDRITDIFKMEEARRSTLNSNPVFRLVGALPFLAGCDEPKRTALSHMAIFLLASSDAAKDIYAHNFRDSSVLQRRLEPISHFSGGNPRIIERGMHLLTLAMLSDHLYDAESDKSLNKLNPVAAGHWDADEIMDRIRRELEVNACPEMDEILNPNLLPNYWEHK